MFCRGCRLYRHCFYHTVFVRKCDDQDNGYYLAGILVSIWCGWLSDYRTSYYVAREFGYQIMANELKIGHVKVTSLYMIMQLLISLGFIYLCPNTVLAHWLYMVTTLVVLAIIYILFMKKYYHLHEEYLSSLKK